MENYQLINIQLIDRPNPPVRLQFNEEEIKALSDSIERQGILVPLLVRPQGERFEIIDGDCRLEAAVRLRLREVPCVVRAAGDSETHILRMLANLDRSNPDPVSEAVYIATAINSGALTLDDFARKLNRSRQWIEDRLSIAEMPDYMQEAIRYKTLPLGVGLALAQIDDDSTRKRWMESAIRDGMTVRAAHDALREYQRLRESWGDAGAPAVKQYIPEAPPVVLYPCARCGGMAPLQDLRLVRIHQEQCPQE